MTTENNQEDCLDIAVVGMAGRFPGADSVEEFWQNLIEGTESISRLSDEELISAGVDQSMIAQPNYIKATPKLKSDPAEFDAKFFGYSPREAQFMDPQHRLFLETAWLAVENSGYAPRDLNFPVAVYGGAAMNTYFMKTGLADRFDEEYLPTLIGNDNSFLATRVSYKLNLSGPSVTVQTACSTSLVAVHQACQSLLNGECEMALAGGVSVRVPQNAGYLFNEGSVASPDGHCRTFDAQAKGTLFGSGVGVVVLKRLVDAQAAGDTVHAVIKGSAINNDGSSKVDYTAPSVDSQADVITEALSAAGVSADSIGYIEAHGTGTFLGDPIEITALTRAFREDTDQTGFCKIGSVKTNIGHLDAAAGIAGLIKTVLALKHRMLPASLHFESPNPHIDFQQSPFVVNDQLCEWRTNSTRRAGITSLGIGGTNAHVILEEAPPSTESSDSRRYQLMCWSGKTETARDAVANNLAASLASGQFSVADTAYTMQLGRTHFDCRSVGVVPGESDSREQAVETLRDRPASRVFHGRCDGTEREVAFLFSGQGSQFPNMTRMLYEQEPVYRRTVDKCLRILGELPFDELQQLKGILFPAADHEREAAAKLQTTAITQPALFTVEYSLAKLFMHWGIEPAMLAGHSIGEYVAACLAGVFSLESALRLVAKRGQLMQSMPTGSMVAVMLSEQEVLSMLDERHSLAVVNGPAASVVAGTHQAIEELQHRLAADHVDYRPLQTSHAFHSSMMDPILDEFTRAVETESPKAPQLPLISNVTGSWMLTSEVTDPNFWALQLRQTVRFHDCLSTLLSEPNRVLIEAGPGNTLVGFARQHPDKQQSHTFITTSRHSKEPMDDDAIALRALGQLWMAGCDIDWDKFYEAETRKRVPLPGYPFQRQRHWYQTKQAAGHAVERAANIADWFYAPSWTRAMLPNAREDISRGESWLIVTDETAVGAELARICRASGGIPFVATLGAARSQVDDNGYALGQADLANAYRLLLAEITNESHRLHRVFFLSKSDHDAQEESNLEKFFELFELTKSLLDADVAGSDPDSSPIHLCVACNGLADVLPDDEVNATQALVLGPARVIAKESPGIKTSIVDAPFNEMKARELAGRLVTESQYPGCGEIIALRGHQRWRQALDPIRLEATDEQNRLRQHGVYLVTGGLGGIGLALARHLAANYSARLVLTGRSPLPSQDQWEMLLRDTATEMEFMRHRIQAVRELEQMGAEVATISGDVADPSHVSAIVELASRRFGRVDGVFHAAGVVDDCIIQLKSAGSAARVLSPKVIGARNLSHGLAGLDVDFLVLFSSINALLAPAGQADYAAANAFLDGFARASQAGMQVLTVSWPGWQDVGLLSRLPDSSWRDAALAGGVAPQDGIEALERALSQLDCNHLVVSPTRFEFPAKISRRVVTATESAAESTAEIATDFAAITGAVTQYATHTQEVVASIWEDLLGVKSLSPDDDYMLLGGSSLLATQMIARIQARLNKKLTIRDVLDHPTISEISGLIDDTAVPASTASTASTVDALRLAQPADIHVSETSPADVARDFHRTNGREPIPLSSSQARMWYMHKLYPGSVADNLPRAYRLHGKLDISALQRSADAIVRRHEILRTVFRDQDGIPVQFVCDAIEVPWSIVDLSGFVAAERNAALEEQTTQAARYAFDLEHGPLFRLTLFKLASEEHVLLFNLHHIVADGWSYGLLEKDLQSCYEAFAYDTELSLPALEFQYRDYVFGEKEDLPSARQKFEYWQRQLAGELRPTDLPTDKVRPSVQTFEGAKHPFAISANTYGKLKSLCQAERSTTFMAALAALNALIYRYCNAGDIVVGTPVSLRKTADMESVVGICLNMLALRIQIDENMTGRELLARSRAVTLDGYEHRDLPFNEVVERLDRAADPSRAPLFQVMLQVSQNSLLALPGIEVERYHVDSNTAQYDLAFHIWEGPDGIWGHTEYNTALFTASAIERLVGHFVTLLNSIAEQPETAIRNLPMLPASELQQQLVLWNQTQCADDIDTTIHEVFRESARKWPAKVAVECVDKQLTYEQLNRESDRFAASLRRRGAGNGSRIGVYMERSCDLLVALLGVLKAGAAYVPLDPSFPHDRLAYMLSNSDAQLVVAQESLTPLPFEHSAEIVCIDGDWDALHNGTAVDEVTTPSNSPAYVIYTSGSTGQPKGVQIGHRAAVNFLKSMSHEPGMSEDDVTLAITTLSFDIALLELFLPLFVGAKTFIVGRDAAVDGHRLADLVDRTSTTLMQATPATWRMMLDTGWEGVRQRDFKILCGGEALTAGLAAELLDRCSELWNMYGPTETTVWSTVACIRAPNERITIGRPIRNTEIYILDQHLQPVPVGVPGTLYIGGAGLADGYHQLPELTDEKFIISPLSDSADDRIYNTGDLARYACVGDGTIEHLGRVDGQVKIRGFRIELGEVEAVLSKYPSVERAVVIDRKDHGDALLAAYLVTSDDKPVSVSHVRRFMSQRLPGYMIPAAFMTVDEIPLTPNKKVDRRALPTPELVRPELEHDYQGATTQVEEQLVQIWQRALKRKPIGVRDNFFDLGGNSLKAVQLFNVIEEMYSRRLSLASLFQTPTIETLAATLSTPKNPAADEQQPTWNCLVPIQPNGDRPPLYLIHAAGGNVLLYADLLARLHPDQPVYGLQSRGMDGVTESLDCIEDMASHYMQEILAHQPKGPFHLGGYCMGGSVAYEIARRLQEMGHEVGIVALIESYVWSNLDFSLSEQFRVFFERIAFHAANIAMLRGRQKLKYVATKASIEWHRLCVRVRSLRSAVGMRTQTASSIRRKNHRSSFTFRPKPFAGRVTHFRPCREFSIVVGSNAYWDRLAEGGVDSVRLNAYPAGTLVEPFVRELAEELEARLSPPQFANREIELHEGLSVVE